MRLSELKQLMLAAPKDLNTEVHPNLILTLIERIEKLRDALSFYASTTRWEWTTHNSTYDGIGCTDFESFKSIAMGFSQVGGKTARGALLADDALDSNTPKENKS